MLVLERCKSVLETLEPVLDNHLALMLVLERCKSVLETLEPVLEH